MLVYFFFHKKMSKIHIKTELACYKRHEPFTPTAADQAHSPAPPT